MFNIRKIISSSKSNFQDLCKILNKIYDYNSNSFKFDEKNFDKEKNEIINKILNMNTVQGKGNTNSKNNNSIKKEREKDKDNEESVTEAELKIAKEKENELMAREKDIINMEKILDAKNNNNNKNIKENPAIGSIMNNSNENAILSNSNNLNNINISPNLGHVNNFPFKLSSTKTNILNNSSYGHKPTHCLFNTPNMTKERYLVRSSLMERKGSDSNTLNNNINNNISSTNNLNTTKNKNFLFNSTNNNNNKCSLQKLKSMKNSKKEHNNNNINHHPLQTLKNKDISFVAHGMGSNSNMHLKKHPRQDKKDDTKEFVPENSNNKSAKLKSLPQNRVPSAKTFNPINPNPLMVNNNSRYEDYSENEVEVGEGGGIINCDSAPNGGNNRRGDNSHPPHKKVGSKSTSYKQVTTLKRPGSKQIKLKRDFYGKNKIYIDAKSNNNKPEEKNNESNSSFK